MLVNAAQHIRTFCVIFKLLGLTDSVKIVCRRLGGRSHFLCSSGFRGVRGSDFSSPWLLTVARLSVPKQAFVEATVVNNSAISYGARGIAGLGFTSLSSIDAEGNQTHSNADRSLLYNLFQVNHDEPNFVGFMLQQNSSDDSQVGSFAIGKPLLCFVLTCSLSIELLPISRRIRSRLRAYRQPNLNINLACWITKQMDCSLRLNHSGSKYNCTFNIRIRCAIQ